jgi:hypothetical protein
MHLDAYNAITLNETTFEKPCFTGCHVSTNLSIYATLQLRTFEQYSEAFRYKENRDPWQPAHLAVTMLPVKSFASSAARLYNLQLLPQQPVRQPRRVAPARVAMKP